MQAVCSGLSPLLSTILIALLLPVFATGCGNVGVGTYRLNSVTGNAAFSPPLDAIAYRTDDKNSAVFILTDLPTEALRPGASLDGVSGNIVRISLFLRPFPGRTPISDDAFNAAVTHAVIADGRIGIYQGGGFLLPRGSAGDETFGGSMTDATLRLSASTQGFADLLGTTALDVSFRAPRQPGLAELAERRIAQLVATAERSQ